MHRNLTVLVCEFEGVGEKVQQNLQKAALITKHGIYHAHVALGVYLGRQLNFVLVGARNQNLKCLVNCLTEVEVVLTQVKGVIL
jgi:hypothetical protein